MTFKVDFLSAFERCIQWTQLSLALGIKKEAAYYMSVVQIYAKVNYNPTINHLGLLK